MDAPSINNRSTNGSLRFHRRNERMIVRMKTVKSKSRRPEKATAVGFPGERGDMKALYHFMEYMLTVSTDNISFQTSIVMA